MEVESPELGSIIFLVWLVQPCLFGSARERAKGSRAVHDVCRLRGGDVGRGRVVLSDRARHGASGCERVREAADTLESGRGPGERIGFNLVESSPGSQAQGGGALAEPD